MIRYFFYLDNLHEDLRSTSIKLDVENNVIQEITDGVFTLRGTINEFLKRKKISATDNPQIIENEIRTVIQQIKTNKVHIQANYYLKKATKEKYIEVIDID